MRIYFAGAEPKDMMRLLTEVHREHFGCLPRVLVSYFGLKSSDDKLERIIGDVFLDSGAFSAWTRGVRIDIDEYIAYLGRHAARFTLYANLDVIGDHAATVANQRRIEAAGLRPLPVFHMGAPQEPYHSLDALCHEYDYIALGGLAGKNFSSTEKRAHLDKCWSVISTHFARGRRVKVHGFGVTQLAFLERYPFYSVDSTTWLNGSRYGEVQVFDSGTIVKTRSLKTESKAKSRRVRSPLSLASDAEKLRLNVRAFKHHEEYLTRLWAQRGIVWT